MKINSSPYQKTTPQRNATGSCPLPEQTPQRDQVTLSARVTDPSLGSSFGRKLKDGVSGGLGTLAACTMMSALPALGGPFGTVAALGWGAMGVACEKELGSQGDKAGMLLLSGSMIAAGVAGSAVWAGAGLLGAAIGAGTAAIVFTTGFVDGFRGGNLMAR